MPERKKSFSKQFRQKGLLVFSLAQRLFIITILATIIYLILYPLFIQVSFEYFLNFLGIDPNTPIAISPDIQSNTDILGVFAYLIYIAIFLFIIRVFVVEANTKQIIRSTLGLATFVAIINLTVYIFFTQFVLGTIAFIIFENITFTFPSFISLSGLIIQNDILLIFFAVILLPSPKKKKK